MAWHPTDHAAGSGTAVAQAFRAPGTSAPAHSSGVLMFAGRSASLFNAVAIALLAVDCGQSGPCGDVSGTCVAFDASTATEPDIETAVQSAKPGTTIVFGAGTFKFKNTMAVASSGLTIRGAGIGQTILDFDGMTAGSDGIAAQDGSNNLTLTGFTVQNTKGNAIKVIGSDYVVFRAVSATWKDAAKMTNGPYGLYPVSSTHVLIENCVVSNASDSGIYVGQSDTVIVRNNEVLGNVAGIEIENTFNADVTGNNVHDNTAGIMVFNLPDLPQQGGHNVRVFSNKVLHNNLANFAAQGDIVSFVPSGAGIIVMASYKVEVFGNTITGNNTGCFGVVSYYATQLPWTDPNYYPFPHDVWAHDNTCTGDGTMPDFNVQLGLLLLSAQSAFPMQRVPDQIWDGIPDPAWVQMAVQPDGGIPPNVMHVCFSSDGDSFANLNLPFLNDAGTNLAQIFTTDLPDFTCTQDPLPAIVVDGGTP
jgi:parallel beta-helix repeat protein